uniref:Uncharacterized protein n=1 Tax=Anopheles merus TaxID=30066 RepID=A0A182VGN0_ANOME
MMRKLYTISKMIQYEHTWIVEPSAFEAHCPRCEVLTGATKWELNCCTAGVQSAGDYAYCSKCDDPYVKLLSDESQDVIIAVHEEVQMICEQEGAIRPGIGLSFVEINV